MNEQQKAMLDRQLKLQRGAAIIEGTQDKFRQDGYSNLLTKYGTSQDSSTSYQYNQESITDDMELIRLYEGNGLFTKIIDRPAEEAVKHGFDIDFGDEDVNEYVDDRMDDLDFEEKFATAEKWARLFGGAIIVMLVDDGRGLEEPLDWSNVRTIDELRVFERAIVQPDYTSMYHFHFLDTLDSARPFAEPEFYQVYSIYGYFVVHRSRCLVFRNGRLPEQTTNAIYRYWGIPEYVKIKRALRECITSHENGTKLLERCVQAIYKMRNLANLLSTEDGENKVLQRLQVIDMARSILNSIAIDSEGEEYDFKTFTMSGVKEVLDSTCNMLSAVTEIPQTILFGRSPAGMNSTGESDMENYYNMVENIQKQNMKKNSRTVIDLILRQGLLEDKIPEVPKYKMKFAALWSMSESEQASVDKTKADTEHVKAQTAQVYMDSNVLDPSEVRKSLADEGNFDIENVLSGDELNLPDDVFGGLPTHDIGKQIFESREFASYAPRANPGEPIEILDQSNDEAGIDIINVDLPDDQRMVNDKVFANDIEEYADRSSINEIVINMDGGPGSGDWGHSGRPGKIGGSGGGGGKEHRTGTKEKGFSSAAKEREKKKTSGGGNSGGISKGNGGSSSSGNVGNKTSHKPDKGAKEEKKMDVKSISRIERSQESNEWASVDEDDRLAFIEDAREEYSNYSFSRNGTLANAIASEERMNTKPTSLSEKEFDEYVSQTGSQKIYRGVQNFEDDEGEILRTGAEIRKEFVASDDSTYGGGNYGSGYHFSDSKAYAQGFARKSEGGELFECAIKPGAQIMNSSAWENLPRSVKEKYDNDAGLYALTHGYDGIRSDTGVTNIVNRGALVYKEPGKTDSNEDGKTDYHAAAVIIINDGKILCASRSNGEGICGPGGHIEEDETPEEAAIREAMEEFSVIPHNLIPIGTYKDSTGRYCTSMIYFTDQFSGAPEADGDEMLDARWMSLEKLHGRSLFPPFKASLRMLVDFLNKFLTAGNPADNVSSEETFDGGPGSGRYPKGSGKKGAKNNAAQKKKAESLPMTAKEKAKVTHDINNLYHAKYEGKSHCYIRTHSNEPDSPSYVYRFKNNGFNDYDIYMKKPND